MSTSKKGEVGLRPSLPKVKRKKRQKLDDGLTERQKSRVRRSNNRNAAQNLRDRKKDYETELETSRHSLELENERLKGRLETLQHFGGDLKHKIRVMSAVLDKMAEMEGDQGVLRQLDAETSSSLQTVADESSVNTSALQPEETFSLVPLMTASMPAEIKDISPTCETGSFILPSSMGEDGQWEVPTNEILDTSSPSSCVVPQMSPAQFRQDASDITMDTAPDLGGRSVSESIGETSFESAELKPSSLPSEIHPLSYMLYLLGLSTFVQPEGPTSSDSKTLSTVSSPVPQRILVNLEKKPHHSPSLSLNGLPKSPEDIWDEQVPTSPDLVLLQLLSVLADQNLEGLKGGALANALRRISHDRVAEAEIGPFLPPNPPSCKVN